MESLTMFRNHVKKKKKLPQEPSLHRTMLIVQAIMQLVLDVTNII